ncbi:MAG: type II toxin-antitoxin system VapB family antitoxin [Propionibacteriaceae bacterium]|jgi:Arc/MetJ family transcription regulator|nr:type II toxin-antitoxin system VapB family antitoxin [Propionibacteriaceae bacterium]
MGRTNVVLDDDLLARVQRLTGARTKREAVNLALAELVEARSRQSILELDGRPLLMEGYDHRALREGRA